MLRDFIYSILKDDEGISEESFDKLVVMLSKMKEYSLLHSINEHVDGCEGRVFLPKKFFDNVRDVK